MVNIQLCNYEEALNRIKWMLICHGILWIVLFIAILMVGDSELLLLINPNDIDNTHIVYKIVKLFSDMFYILLLGTMIMVPIFLAVPKLENYRRPMLESFVSMFLGGIIVTQILKAGIARYRPFDISSPIAEDINLFGDLQEGRDAGSMPSGHVSNTGAIVLPHAIHLKNMVIAIIISLFSAGMMYARMFLGMHYATDVLVGNIVAVVISIATFFLFEGLYRNVEMKRVYEWLIYAGIAIPMMLLLVIQLSSL
ncbi:MAG: phosphatase PAP2 family protein [archaeon]|nr:phosphatase PAP2 family protein [archaeon]